MPGNLKRQRHGTSKRIHRMRPRRTLAVALLLPAVLLAGCFGDDTPADDGPMDGEMDDWETEGPSPTTPENNQTRTDSNVTWSHENRTGTVSGTALVVMGGDAAEEPFDVQGGTISLVLNVSIDGDAVSVQVSGPDCDDEQCRQSIATGGDGGTWTTDMPEPGRWTVYITPETTVGPYSSEYDLGIAQAESPWSVPQ